eukprot:TRINITY_DN8844_c0_g1_i1.p1 TRINITY_DN8844_c0_g1~~TRINITY_DN8844_c0_g1_i1.p1  ORF type:complete len:313 (+),score=72.29 TRINITY_DN8844_c0_g1_i1:77-1015(+)
MRSSILITVLAISLHLAAGSIIPYGWLSYWAYDTYYGATSITAPNQWYLYSSSCSGLTQSPINIVPDDATIKWAERSKGSTLYLECSTVSFVVENRGSAVSFVAKDPSSCKLKDITGSAYYLGSIEFHWNKNAFSQIGSEHTIDLFSYPIEAQLLFFRTDFSSSNDPIESAKVATAVGSVVGIASFLTAGPGAKNADLAKFGIMSSLVPGSYNGTTGFTLNPMSLIPNADLSIDSKGYYAYQFYRYTGSLTYPPCTPNILWNVFHNPVHLPIDQITRFRSVKLDLVREVINNNRPTTKYVPAVQYYMKSPSW